MKLLIQSNSWSSIRSYKNKNVIMKIIQVILKTPDNSIKNIKKNKEKVYRKLNINIDSILH